MEHQHQQWFLSGASTGSKEALELRDNDISYHGKSVIKAVNNINNILSSLVIGKIQIIKKKLMNR